MTEQLAVLARTSGAADAPTVRERGDALWTLGEDLLRLGQLEEGADRLGEAAALLWPFAAEHPTAVIACSRQATALMRLGRHDDAYEVLRGVIEKIGLEWDYARVPDLMALVLADWLSVLDSKRLRTLRRMSVVEQGEEVAEVVLRRYEGGDTPTQRIAIGRALRQKAVGAIMRADWPAALDLYDELIRRCPIEDYDAVRDSSVEMRLGALTTRGLILERLARNEEALASYEEALRGSEFVRAPGPSFRKILKDAQRGKKRTESRRRSGLSGLLRRSSKL